MIELRKVNEKEFFDIESENAIRKRVSEFYTSDTVYIIRNEYENYLIKNSKNNIVLELGCGVDSYALLLAREAEKIYGIDISDNSIKVAKEKAVTDNIKNVEYIVMDAEKMEFKNELFGLVCGVSILHHLELEAAINEIGRTLKTNGKAIFIEPLGLNPLINLFRKLTPSLRTKDEHPLKKKDVKYIESRFSKSESKYFYLFSLIALPFKNTPIFNKLFKYLNSFDEIMIKLIPPFKYFAWQVLLILEGPKRDAVI